MSLLQKRVKETFAHSNVWFHHNSLETKMYLNVKNVSRVDVNMQASEKWMNWTRDTHLPSLEEDICDLYHYMTVYKEGEDGEASGVAELGVVCINEIIYKAGISSIEDQGSQAEDEALLAIVRILKNC